MINQKIEYNRANRATFKLFYWGIFIRSMTLIKKFKEGEKMNFDISISFANDLPMDLFFLFIKCKRCSFRSNIALFMSNHVQTISSYAQTHYWGQTNSKTIQKLFHSLYLKKFFMYSVCFGTYFFRLSCRFS